MDIAQALTDEEAAALAARISPFLSTGPDEYTELERERMASQERIALAEAEAAVQIAEAEADAIVASTEVAADAEVIETEIEAETALEIVDELVTDPEEVAEAVMEAAEEVAEADGEIDPDEALTLEDIGAAESEDIEPPDVSPARNHFMFRPIKRGR